MKLFSIDFVGKGADVGSGGGLPAIPFLILFNNIKLDLIESSHNKAIYLRHVLQKSKLLHGRVVEKRAEEIGHRESNRENYDFVVTRAVAPLQQILNLSLPLVKVGGKCFFYLGPKTPNLVEEQKDFLRELGGRICYWKQYRLTYQGRKRVFLCIDKIERSSSKYPVKKLKIK